MKKTTSKILVLGASGMLGNAVLRIFSESDNYITVGTVRSEKVVNLLPVQVRERLIIGFDLEDVDNLIKVFDSVKPDVVINCIGVVKQLPDANDPLSALPLNSILPHRLANLCGVAGARFVHMSTDCVYSGCKGMYTEEDFPDATDLYGRSKLLGEVDYPHAITLRTSIIGHELAGARSLLCWFLGETGCVSGFSRAVFSGLPTVEIARLIRDYVLPNPQLHGVYHVSSDPINKYDLLKLVARTYGKIIDIEKNEDYVIDRSLDSVRFREKTGYIPASWERLIISMHEFR